MRFFEPLHTMRHTVRLSFALASSLLMSSGSAMAIPTSLVSVNVNDPGNWRSFVVGEAVDYNPNSGNIQRWADIPAELSDLDFYFVGQDPAKSQGPEYGMLHFTALTTGTLWMLTTSRYGGGGNPSGGWVPEVTSPAMLVSEGWSLLRSDIQTESGTLPPGSNPLNDYHWDLWQVNATAGESFSMRTEKYVPPVILRGEVSSVPDAGSTSVLLFSALAAIRMLKRKTNG